MIGRPSPDRNPCYIHSMRGKYFELAFVIFYCFLPTDVVPGCGHKEILHRTIQEPGVPKRVLIDVILETSP